MRTQRTHFTNLKWVEERGVGYEGEGEGGGDVEREKRVPAQPPIIFFLNFL